MFVLCSKITIGGMTFNSVHGVTIKRSIFEIGATAIIRVPVTAVIKQMGVPPTYIETARAINVGDPVTIALGYDGILKTEFVGYVKAKNLKTPLEIECEDAFYKTRTVNVSSSGETTLEAIVGSVGAPIGYCTTLALEDFPIDNKPGSWVLGKLKTDFGLSIWFDLQGRLYVSEPYKVQGNTVKYRLRENTINEDELKYHLADDVKLKIKAVCIFRSGEKIEATIGTGSTEKTLYFYDVKKKSDLAALAAAELKRYSYDGYRGKVTTFLRPYAEPAMKASIIDPLYQERNGDYYIESTEVEFGTGGGRRTVALGLKL